MRKEGNKKIDRRERALTEASSQERRRDKQWGDEPGRWSTQHENENLDKSQRSIIYIYIIKMGKRPYITVFNNIL